MEVPKNRDGSVNVFTDQENTKSSDVDSEDGYEKKKKKKKKALNESSTWCSVMQ